MSKLGKTMHAENLNLWVNYLSNEAVPLLSSTVQSILKLNTDENATCKQLADIILRDPSLTARIVRIANSPYYHRGSHSLTDIRQAVLILGFEKIVHIALTVSIINVLVNKHTMQHIVSLMIQSLQTAMLARQVAARLSLKHSDDVYLAGLLYDIGEIVFWSLSGKAGEVILKQLNSYPLPAKKAQQEFLGTTFDDIGAALLNEWGLSSLLSCTLKHQQRPDPYIQCLVVSHQVIHSIDADEEQYRGAVKKLAEIINITCCETEELIQQQYREASVLSHYYLFHR